jgi:hypothetical protein
VSRVSGIATGPDGPASNLPITLVPAEADEAASSIEVINGFTDDQGRFTLEGVPPGQYILRAVRTPRVALGGPGQVTTISQGGLVTSYRVSSAGPAAPLPTDPTLWAEMNVSVGAKDINELPVGLRPGIKMTGSLQFNGGAERPTPDQLGGIVLTLEPADSRRACRLAAAALTALEPSRRSAFRRAVTSCASMARSRTTPSRPPWSAAATRVSYRSNWSRRT